AMSPVAGSAYTYAYATLGELFAWIIGWDLVLEYAMSCGVLAADWTKYFNVLLKVLHIPPVPEFLSSDPFTTPGAWFSLPAVIIMALATFVLVIGIRESATPNTILVLIKIAVVLFVIGVGIQYINPANWNKVPAEQRKFTDVNDLLRRRPEVARLLPSGRYKHLTGKQLLNDYPQAAGILSRDVIDQINKLPNLD